MNTFEYFFQNTQDLCCIANVDGYFEIINPSFKKVLGYSKKELLENKFFNFIHPDDIDITQKEVEKLQTGILAINFVNRYRKKDGNYLWFEWNTTPEPSTGKLYAIARDITERKLAEVALHESEEKYRDLFDNAHDIIQCVDGTGKIIYVNNAWKKTTGYSDEEIKVKNIFEIIHPDCQQHCMDVFQLISKGENIDDFEIEYLTKDKRKVIVNGSTTVKMVDGKIVSSRGIFRDITQKKINEEAQKIIQQELDNKTKELSQSNTELEQFAYVASHDLQEPLRMVTGYLHLLEKRYKDKLDQDAADFIGFAVDGANHMRILIQSLLEYSRINRIKPFEELDVNLLLKDVLANVNASVKENKAVVKINELPQIYGDTVLINQLFQNLIENAIKFKGDKNPEIIISGKKENNNYLFSVKDNGIGIQKEYADKIFVMFQRLHSKEKYLGTGIGLAICKKIVERHGGEIWVESEPGKGSTFNFSIKN